MARTIGDTLAERIDTGGLNAAAVDALLAERAAGAGRDKAGLRYGVGAKVVDRLELGAQLLRDAPANEASEPAQPATDPTLLLIAWTCVAERMARLCDRVEELREIPEKPDRGMTPREREVYQLLRSRGAMQATDILDAVGSTGSNVRRILRNLRGFGLVVKSGTTQSAYYAAVAEAPGTQPGTRAPRPAPAKQTAPEPEPERAAAPERPRKEPTTLTEGEATLLRALIRKPAAPLPDLCKEAGLNFGQANGLHQSLKRKGFIATEGGQRRVLRRPDGQRMPNQTDAQLQAQVEAMAAAGRVTKCPTRFAAASQAGDLDPAVSSPGEGRIE